MSLDINNTRIGYRLGRLFAVLEKLQEDAYQRTLNTTIRDKYYSSASSMPASVFSTLMRLHIHHLKKIEKQEWRNAFQKRIQDILDPVSVFPTHLNLEEQALFALGYYHQRQDFFKKKELDKGEAA